MFNTSIVTVLGTALPPPSTYKATTADLVDSGRNAQGVIVSNVIRSDIAKIECTWNYLTLEQWAMICGLFKNKWSGAVRFLNQTTGSWETRTMYVGDRTADEAVSIGGRITGWKQCKLSLMEV